TSRNLSSEVRSPLLWPGGWSYPSCLLSWNPFRPFGRLIERGRKLGSYQAQGDAGHVWSLAFPSGIAGWREPFKRRRTSKPAKAGKNIRIRAQPTYQTSAEIFGLSDKAPRPSLYRRPLDPRTR